MTAPKSPRYDTDMASLRPLKPFEKAVGLLVLAALVAIGWVYYAYVLEAPQLRQGQSTWTPGLDRRAS